jgi:hypothetical protein
MASRVRATSEPCGVELGRGDKRGGMGTGGKVETYGVSRKKVATHLDVEGLFWDGRGGERGGTRDGSGERDSGANGQTVACAP